MSIFDSEEDLKEYMESNITRSRKLIKLFEKLVKGDPTSEAKKGMVEDQKKHLSLLQENYNQRYGKADMKQLSAKEIRNVAFNNGFTVIKGGLYKVEVTA